MIVSVVKLGFDQTFLRVHLVWKTAAARPGKLISFSILQKHGISTESSQSAQRVQCISPFQLHSTPRVEDKKIQLILPCLFFVFPHLLSSDTRFIDGRDTLNPSSRLAGHSFDIKPGRTKGRTVVEKVIPWLLWDNFLTESQSPMTLENLILAGLSFDIKAGRTKGRTVVKKVILWLLRDNLLTKSPSPKWNWGIEFFQMCDQPTGLHWPAWVSRNFCQAGQCRQVGWSQTCKNTIPWFANAS